MIICAPALAAARITDEQIAQLKEVLREMDPEMSLADPYSNGLLKMLRKGDTLTIYSVGNNGEDDGGAPYSVGQWEKVLGDLPFTIGKGTAQ